MATQDTDVVTAEGAKALLDEYFTRTGGGFPSLTLNVTFSTNSNGMKVRYVGADAQVHDLTQTGSIEVKAGVPVALVRGTSNYYPYIQELSRGTYAALRDFVPLHETNASADAFAPLVDMTLTLTGSM